MFRKNHPHTINGFVRDISHRPTVPKGYLLLVLGIIVFGLLAVPLLGVNGLASWANLSDEEKELSAKVTSLQQSNLALTRDIEAIKHDPATLEKFAREEFNMHLPCEKVVLVIDKKPIKE